MWYVIQTMKGKEYKAAEEVRCDVAAEDEAVFVLENEMEYKVNGGWIKDTNPFFPGYIFADLNSDMVEDFDYRLRKEKHPLKLLRVDDIITPIRPEEEEYLKRLGGEEHIVRNSEGYRVDDMIEITSGSFKGWTGEIRKLDRHKRRATICVTMMGREVEVNIGLEIVKFISGDQLGGEDGFDRENMARIVKA
ncbi:antiterminator LoaP [Oribacterium sp. FC2011]|uniref:antiterminator LoaP n=1 Tax=Oribacterium sp. FC2011 TaxID=1408311 RepID=UPI0006792985|nr:antiterminator LoaP [Oribacterium sp. FC2011]